MFNYLYYKLYRAAKHSSLHSTAEFTATIFLGGLIGANILVIGAFFVKMDMLNIFFRNKFQAGACSFLCIVIASVYYLSNKRYKPIIKKYSQESNRARVRGNIIVSVYVALSFLLIFAVAFFKPGKL
jgi:hypothetical protein